MEVVTTAGFDSTLLARLDLGSADVLLVDLDASVDQELEPLTALLSRCRVPVLFNDGSETRPGAPAFDRLSRRLTVKLAALAAH